MRDLVRLPRGPAAQLRGDLRHLGIRRGARLWGLRERHALMIAAGLPAPREAIARVLRRVLAALEGRA